MNNTWAIIGLGFISQRHIDSIKNIGDKLLMACDVDESKKEKVPDVRFFNDYNVMLADPEFSKVDCVAICTPNYLHYQMIKKCVDAGKRVLCEKPLVIDSKQLESLSENVGTVLQLRYNPEIIEAKKEIEEQLKKLEDINEGVVAGELTMKLNRGDFYWRGWKGDEAQSGGLLFNIGIHYFDLIVYLLGTPTNSYADILTKSYAKGLLIYPKVVIFWELSLEAPMDNQIRRLKLFGKNFDLTRNFDGLHQRVYEDFVAGKLVAPSQAKDVIKLVEELKVLGIKK